ncbi:glycosyltransferase family A protein [Paraclostridium bifermentans]|uniref:glycosyltransferase family A protein n=1 Tax=Paraclostridium bifermentans TaxID=1490 RepID=UPI00359C29D4
MKILTIFTPTYNRANLLDQLYNSLKNQTNKDFTWLIVDDGSKDNTEEVINKYKSENIIEIEYIKQKNGGKHRAFNKGIENCKTAAFICVDSDDYIVDDAVEKIINRYNSIKDDENIAGIAGLCIDKQNNILGGKYPKEGLISDTMNIRDVYGLPGEPEIYKTHILKKYRFEEFDNEKFITEAILFDKLTSEKKIKYFNDILMVKEYLEGGLTDHQLKIRIDSINGTKTYYNQRMNLSQMKKAKIKATINHSRFCIHDKSIKEVLDCKYKCLALVTFPLALGMYFKDKMEMKGKYN